MGFRAVGFRIWNPPPAFSQAFLTHACMHICKLCLAGWLGGGVDGWVGGWMDGWMDGMYRMAKHGKCRYLGPFGYVRRRCSDRLGEPQEICGVRIRQRSPRRGARTRATRKGQRIPGAGYGIWHGIACMCVRMYVWSKPISKRRVKKTASAPKQATFSLKPRPLQ